MHIYFTNQYVKYKKERYAMSKKKKEAIQLSLKLNLILGCYNIYLFSLDNMLFNLLVGSTNIGVWVFFRDMKLIPVIIKYTKGKN